MSTDPLDAVVFDLDGTLVDTMVSVPQAYVDTVRRLGGPPVAADHVVAVWNLGPTPAVLEHLVGRPMTQPDIDVFFEELDRAASRAAPFDGIVDLLDELDQLGLPAAVLTNATHRGARQLLAATGLDDRFGLVLGADQTPRLKPHPDGLLLVCERLEVDPDRVAFVGDAQSDIDAANNAGAVAVAAGWSPSTGPMRDRHLVAQRPGDILDLIGAAPQRQRIEPP